MGTRLFTLPLLDQPIGEALADPFSSARQFLTTLLQELQVLRQFVPEISVSIRADEVTSVYFDDQSSRFDASEADPDSGWWVCSLEWKRSDDQWVHGVDLYSGDFLGDSPRAVEVFTEMFTHLKKINYPGSIPDKLRAALDALK